MRKQVELVSCRRSQPVDIEHPELTIAVGANALHLSISNSQHRRTRDRALKRYFDQKSLMRSPGKNVSQDWLCGSSAHRRCSDCNEVAPRHDRELSAFAVGLSSFADRDNLLSGRAAIDKSFVDGQLLVLPAFPS